MLFDFAYSPLAVFSRAHCGAICAFLIPANLALATAVVASTVINPPSSQRNRFLGLSIAAAAVMSFHVGTWLAIGIVHLFTFILLGLAFTCMAVDALAWLYPNKIRQGILRLLAVAGQGLFIQQVENWLKAEIIR
jgi:hypothetical protein